MEHMAQAVDPFVFRLSIFVLAVFVVLVNLLTDAVHNAGPDPRLIARRFPELHVLLETDGEHDAPLGRDLARLGRGKMASVATHRDVAPALNRLLAG